MTTKTKLNKSAIVRGILNDLGALTPTPPDDWKVKLDTELKARGIKIVPTAIYGIRARELEKLGLRNPKRRYKKKDATIPAPAKNVVASSNDLMKVAKFAETVGGFKNLKKLIETIDAIRNS